MDFYIKSPVCNAEIASKKPGTSPCTYVLFKPDVVDDGASDPGSIRCGI